MWDLISRDHAGKFLMKCSGSTGNEPEWASAHRNISPPHFTCKVKHVNDGRKEKNAKLMRVYCNNIDLTLLFYT